MIVQNPTKLALATIFGFVCFVFGVAWSAVLLASPGNVEVSLLGQVASHTSGAIALVIIGTVGLWIGVHGVIDSLTKPK